MQVSQSNSRNCSSSQIETLKRLCGYDNIFLVMRTLAELRPSASHASSTNPQPHHIHIQNIVPLSCPSQQNAVHRDGSQHYKTDEQVIQV